MAFSTHDVVPDSPINNFATLNPLIGSAGTYSNGNTKIDATNTKPHFGTIACPVGEISYFEVIPVSTTKREIVGFGTLNADYKLEYYNWQSNDTRLIHEAPTGYIGSHLNNDITGDIVGLALDLTGQYTNIKMYVNGSLLTDQTTTTLVESVSSMFPMVQSATGAFTFLVNFGQDHNFGGAKTGGGGYQDANGTGQFYYEPPEGALSLCTANIPSGPIDIANDDVPSDYMKAVTYTGNNTAGHQITTVGFRSDLIWIKDRDVASQHVLIDSVRGHDRELFSSNTNAEQNSNTSGHVSALSAITDNGFTLNQNVYPTGSTNGPTKHIAWVWKAAGAPDQDYASANDGSAKIINEDGSANTSIQDCAALASAAGASITPSKVSANRQNGFSIVSYTGNGTSDISIPHGLGKRPSLMAAKNYENSGSNYHWQVHFFNGLNSRKVGYLNLPNALGDDTTRAVNDNIIEISAGDINRSSGKNIAYIWSEVAGYSKCGSYIGNGSPDGPYVECGFRPAWVMLKNTTTTATNWQLNDNVRDPNNVVKHRLAPSSSEAEQTNYDFGDFLSNGFKIRQTDQTWNKSGDVYIFIAFSEQPFNAPSNAR